MKRIYTLLLSLLFSGTIIAQKPFKLTVKAPDLGAKYFLFANHYGKNKYRVDSVNFNKNGIAQFVDEEDKVSGGIYLCIFPDKGNQYFELIISGKEKNINVEIEKENVMRPKVKGSEENKYFYEDISFLSKYYPEVQKLKGEYEKEKNKKKKKLIAEKLKKQDKILIDRRIKFAKDHPNLLYSNILNMMREIDVPEPKNPNDSTFKYFYYKNHYWDYIDFNDDRLLFTPIFENKFDYYFDKMIIKHPDTIQVEVDRVLGKIKDENSNMMKHCLATLLNKYGNSKIMGQDAMYVHLVNNYYAKGKAPWIDSTNLKKMINDASDLEPLLIGKTAPDFPAFDTSLKNYKRLYDVKSDFKLLVFWNHDCGHCKKEIPRLDSIYSDLKKEGCEIFAVSTVVDTENEVEKWKKFIVDKKLKFNNYADPKHMLYPMFKVLYHIKGTPEYFIIDKDNKIIAKKLGVDQMVDFIKNYKKSHK